MTALLPALVVVLKGTIAVTQGGAFSHGQAIVEHGPGGFLGELAQLSSGSHRAAAWVAQGDLARRRADDAGAAELYRRAAEALQDFRF